jgi:transposase-like protein
MPDFENEVPIGLRRRTGKRKPLSTEEKIHIVHQVLIGHQQQTDVAREHRISNA